jgi:hypothetical protein
MKSTVSSLFRYIGGGSLGLALLMVFFFGCSDNSDGSADKLVGTSGLSRSEWTVLKKANVGSGAFKSALQKRKIEELKEKGVVVEIAPTKPTKRVR